MFLEIMCAVWFSMYAAGVCFVSYTAYKEEWCGCCVKMKQCCRGKRRSPYVVVGDKIELGNME